jgi:2-oxoglutarate ferredoxin oxidoreductase subunit beta
VLSPCPTLYQRRNKMGDGLDAMKYYREASKVKSGVSAHEAPITKDGEIIVGKFVDRVRPDYMELMRNRLSTQLGEDYVEVENLVCS